MNKMHESLLRLDLRKEFNSQTYAISLDKPYLRFVKRFPFTVSFKGTVVDIETSGLDPKLDKLLALSFNLRSVCYVYQLWHPFRTKQFKQICINLLNHCKRPFWAYSPELEQSILGFKRWEDLLEYGEGYSDWRDEPYWYRKSCADASYSNGLYVYGDVASHEVPRLWRRYVLYGDFTALTQIFYHSYCDILRIGWIANKRQGKGQRSA